MKVGTPHSWNVTPAEARAIQQELRSRVIATGGPDRVQLIAGVDISVGSAGRFGRPERPGLAAVVVLEYPSLRPVEQSVVAGQVNFPYVPGLLSFREIPLLIPAFERLHHTPDLVIVDGQGVAHPRRFGIAAHLGLLLNLPAIGCAKSRLTGAYREPAAERGAVSPLHDEHETGEVIGAVVRTRTGVRPLFISVGHRIGLEEAVAWTLNTCTRFRLPEPTRLAHRAAAGEQVVVEP